MDVKAWLDTAIAKIETMSREEFIESLKRAGFKFEEKSEMNKFNEFTQLEGFERVSMLISIIDDRLGSPFINEDGELEYEEDELHKSLYDDKAKRLLATALDSLSELYQHIGEWEFLESSEKWDNRDKRLIGTSEEFVEVGDEIELSILNQQDK